MVSGILLVFFCILIVMSAFFASSETALTAVSRARIHKMARQGKTRAQTVRTLQKNMEDLIGTILLGNNIVNTLATALMTSSLMTVFGESTVGIVTAIMAIFIPIFVEVLPKIYAIHHSEKVALFVSSPLYVIFKILTPLVYLVRIVVVGTLKLVGVEVGSNPALKPLKEEIMAIIEMYGDVHVKNERAMLRSILDLSSIPLQKVMVPRQEMVTLDGSFSLDAIKKTIQQYRFTRFPVWQGSPDHIVGVIHVKALFKQLELSPEAPLLTLLPELGCRPVWFVPESTVLLAQLQAFRQRQEHLALVVDEYGTLQGLVTLEDVLEEIVGEIEDEYDGPKIGIQVEEGGAYLIKGSTPVRDINRDLGWNLPEIDATTLAGLLMHESQSIPDLGKTYRFYGYEFEVLRRTRHQLLLIKVIPLMPSLEETSP